MRLRPTTPELLPSPCGWCSLAELSSSADELIAPHDTMTASAENSCRAPSRSTTTFVTDRPDPFVSRRVTCELVSRVTLGWCRAGSTQQTCASALALTRQGYPSHVAQRMQALCSGLASSIMMP